MMVRLSDISSNGTLISTIVAHLEIMPMVGRLDIKSTASIEINFGQQGFSYTLTSRI